VDHSSATTPEPRLEALRIQAAAVVAQQAALGEREFRLTERESALSRQEEQLAGRLEDQRRQLLDLQDQITEARAALRQKRADHAALAEQQNQELSAAREQAAELQRSAKAERQRLADLRRRMIARGKRHWQARRKETEVREAAVRESVVELAAERARIVAHVEQFNTQAELDKRRLKDAWDYFDRERQTWQARRDAEATAAAAQVRDLVRRSKAVAASERKSAGDRAAAARELADRRRELEHLDTRIGNARLRLLEQQSAVVATPPEMPANQVLAAQISALVPATTDREQALQRRAEALTRVAEDLADQRLHLVEQFERMLYTQRAWHVDRNAALHDLEVIGSRFEARELDLDRRSRELAAARSAVQAEQQSLAQLRLRLEAEKIRAESREADRRAVLDTRWEALVARELALVKQEDGWRALLRRWGRRRREEIIRLRADQLTCRSERSEWVAARTVWLRLTRQVRAERRGLAVRGMALEHLRAETDGSPAAAKRLERLERQWSLQCESAARELERLQATVTAEAVRVDEVSRRVRDELLSAEGRAAVLDNRAAEVEREEQWLDTERARMAGELDTARSRQDAAELRAIRMSDEAERLARLLIDTPAVAMPVSPNQAA
jgi:hypothetical protein